MNLDDLVTEVINLTNRPDKIVQIKSNVKKACLKLHTSDWYGKDLVSVVVSPLVPTIPTDTRYLIDTSASPFTLFRQVKQMNEYNATPTGMEIEFDLRTIDELKDNYGNELTNYILQMGPLLQVRAARQILAATVYYYQYPDITDATFSSWIADELPYCIIDEAAATTFKGVGKDDEAATYKALFPENLMQIRLSGGIVKAS